MIGIFLIEPYVCALKYPDSQVSRVTGFVNFFRCSMLHCNHFLFVGISLLYILYPSSSLSQSNRICKIKVCQNKGCVRKFQGSASNLVQTLRQITEVPIETSSCLSHCDQGPNICIIGDESEEIEHRVQTAFAAAAVLESKNTDLRIPSILLTAWKVIEQGYKGEFPSKIISWTCRQGCIL
jgi:hypothetical protein